MANIAKRVTILTRAHFLFLFRVSLTEPNNILKMHADRCLFSTSLRGDRIASCKPIFEWRKLRWRLQRERKNLTLKKKQVENHVNSKKGAFF